MVSLILSGRCSNFSDFQGDLSTGFQQLLYGCSEKRLPQNKYLKKLKINSVCWVKSLLFSIQKGSWRWSELQSTCPAELLEENCEGNFFNCILFRSLCGITSDVGKKKRGNVVETALYVSMKTLWENEFLKVTVNEYGCWVIFSWLLNEKFFRA